MAKISKQTLLSEMLKNNVALELPQIQSVYSWLNADESKTEEKWELVKAAAKSGNSASIVSLPTVYMWVADSEKERNQKPIAKDTSIDSFQRNLDKLYDMKGEFSPATVTRAKNWIAAQGFKKVSQIVEHGSAKTLSDKKVGKKTIDAISFTLKENYAVATW